MGDVIDLASFADEKYAKHVADRWRFLDGEDLSTELPPTPWVCEALAIAPGPITIVGGAGFGGKTMAMQSFLLSVATGRLAWGQFPVRQGRVKHLDWEQGRPLTQRRYQRLARDMGIDLRAIKDMISASCLPDAHLDDDGAERELAYLLSGVTVAIIDAFRGAFPSALENDSGVRKYLDMLSRVSDRTGCTIIVIAHSKKISADDDNVRSSLRGSGALFDAAQGVLMLNGTKGKPTRVEHTKERVEGQCKDTFGLRIIDVPSIDGDVRWGLRVEYVAPAELQAEYMNDGMSDDMAIAMNGDRLASLSARLIAVISRAPDGLSADTWRALANTSAADLRAVIPEMLKHGTIRQEGRGSTAAYYFVDGGREPGED